MRYNITGKNLEVTEAIRTAIEKKLGKLEHYFNSDTEVHVTLSVIKNRQRIEVTIPVKHNIIRSEQESDDLYVSLDLVEEVLERQLRKYKTKLIARQNAAAFTQEYIDEDAEPEEIEIVKTKKFAVKPMDPEEACVQMELLGHSFYMFSNADTGEVNVVYKRKNGTYGLIEPDYE